MNDSNGPEAEPRGGVSRAARSGRLSARPGAPREQAAPAGTHPLSVGPGHETLLHVPRGYRPDAPVALAVMLHGAGGTAGFGLELLLSLADAANLLLVAPRSQGPTWDVIAGGFGPDVRVIDRALAHVFERYAVDPSRVAIGGFSDGASYALTLGLANGDLFTHVLAFSPGFAAPPVQVGMPRIFLCHGTQDRVLPIEQCGRWLARELGHGGYTVHYREFDGPHIVPDDQRHAAVRWWLEGA
ncbi:phospholipase [Corallococcus exercitus]|uniref:Phospholipase n=1 Tax=Corallococcus exercitus TaxID=2316736 RepID=A0A3A8IIY9_9BACT|nr:phospholipase [Corallococcus exercitus]RKG78221.1 phospholipase [Corallococcus exercitus]